ncbi:TfoX/Sxy family protein [Chitinilyticum litopenaei]|uniref:TfoX/Sxy family protein n=2 Tax=Chitinilyticum piscinae TaxID=2866724 RepID=A0A8J7FKA0_9NEIS|nr:TfoX/Sxy family protein [Chitinilyticum piscinae]
MLHAAGIHSHGELAQLGAVAAWRRIRRHAGKSVSLNLLWALEGALTGRHWQDIARKERSRLLAELAAQDEQDVPAPP